MTLSRQVKMFTFVPTVFGLGLALATTCSLLAQGKAVAHPLPHVPSSEQPITASNSLDPVEASAQLDGLVSRLNDPHSLLRVQAVAAIGGSSAAGGDKASRALQDALEDEDSLVGEAALKALLERGADELTVVRSADLARFSSDAGDLARTRIAAQDADISALRELARNGDAVVQETAFDALAANDTRAAVELLKEEFRDRGSLLRLQTLELLARSPYSNDAATLMPILEAASMDDDPLVRERATEMLTRP